MCSGPSVGTPPAGGSSGTVSTAFKPDHLADLQARRTALAGKTDHISLAQQRILDREIAAYQAQFSPGDGAPPAPTAPGVFAPRITPKTGADALRGIPTIPIPTR